MLTTTLTPVRRWRCPHIADVDNVFNMLVVFTEFGVSTEG
jgi:hypothetical protein